MSQSVPHHDPYDPVQKKYEVETCIHKVGSYGMDSDIDLDDRYHSDKDIAERFAAGWHINHIHWSDHECAWIILWVRSPSGKRILDDEILE